jgi:hypothetical protein
MTYVYREVLIPGTDEGVEGVSAGLVEISTFMQDCGWDLVEDRSAEPATGFDDTHPKYVFSSNGESGNYPTFYMTLYSGSANSQNSNSLFAVAHTAYDIGTHLTPASGVRTGVGKTAGVAKPNDTNAENRLHIRSQDDNTEIYMAGDSEMVHLITRKTIDNNSSNTMDNIMFGRFNSFFSVDENPYPMIVQGNSSPTILTATTTFPRGIWSNPPVASSDRGHIETSQPASNAQLDASMPYSMGVDSIFAALPIAVYYIQVGTTDPVKAVAGTVRNGWISVDASDMLNLSILTASGSGGAQEYRSFTHETSFTIDSLVVRKS